MEDLQKSNSNVSGQDHLINEAPNNTSKNKNIDINSVYSGDSSMQSEAEFEKDKNSDQPSEDTTTASGVDDLKFNSDGAAGTDRAGTAERKTYGDPELNKGLEAQAKDEES